jgi:Stress up-regulated Nod 19
LQHPRVGGRAVAAVVAAVLVCGAAATPAQGALKRVTARQGPFTLQPYQVLFDTSGTRGVRAPRLDGFLVRMHARLVDRHGRPVPVSRIMLHHLVYKDDGRFPGDRRDGTCGGRSQSFYGRGEEDERLRLPRGYGVRLRKGDRWHSNWMLMNHSKVVDRAYIQYTATVDTSPGLTPVTPYWLRVTPCSTRRDPIFDVPGGGAPGSTRTQALDWTVPRSGRIVAGAAHLHGGALSMSLTQPRCGGRTLLTSHALYGSPDHPYYHVWPVLHEPGPIATSWVTSRRGLPVRAGERLRVSALYEDQQAHMRVMGILHVYLARRAKAARDCRALPRDLRATLPPAVGSRAVPPLFPLPLNMLDATGRAQPVASLPSPLQSLAGDGEITLRDVTAVPDRISVPLGATVRWRFRDPIRHDVTLVNGGPGFSSPQQFGGTFAHRFTTPGTYRLFCSLHPLSMPQEVDVRPGS